MKKIELLKETNRMNHLIAYEMNKSLEADELAGLPPKQTEVLLFLAEFGESTVGKLATLLDISRSSMSQLLSRMGRKKLISRRINPHNRKEVFVSLGSKGQLTVSAYDMRRTQLLESYYHTVSLEEVEQLHAIHSKVLAHIDSMKTHP